MIQIADPTTPQAQGTLDTIVLALLTCGAAEREAKISELRLAFRDMAAFARPNFTKAECVENANVLIAQVRARLQQVQTPGGEGRWSKPN